MARLALVTGAARGIGFGIAEALRRDGVEVVAPPRAELDLGDPQSVARWLDRNADVPLDVLVNNAGENCPAPIKTLAPAGWQRTLDVNLTGPFLLIQAFGPRMAARGGGRIVNVSSIYGALARPGRAAYSASKAGLEALTRTAAVEFGPAGVLVNAVAPGFVDTELTRRNNGPEQIAALCRGVPLGRLGRVEEIAEVVRFLASEQNGFLTGQTLVVDGGYSIQ